MQPPKRAGEPAADARVDTIGAAVVRSEAPKPPPLSSRELVAACVAGLVFGVACLVWLAIPASTSVTPATSILVPLKKQGRTFVVPVLINNAIYLDFTVDSGASDVIIPVDVVNTLIRAGTLNKTDFIGTQTYALADGSTMPSQTFRIRSLAVGNRIVENVTGSVAPVNGSLLLGQSFLSRFTSWSIDNSRHALILVESGEGIGDHNQTYPPQSQGFSLDEAYGSSHRSLALIVLLSILTLIFVIVWLVRWARSEHVQGPSGAGPHFSSPGMGLLNHLFPEGSQLSSHAKAKREVLQVWQTFLEHDPDVSEAVERLSALSPRNVEEFRTLLLQHRDRTRVKEFEDEAIRRVQGPAFVGDAPLRQAYISLNQEDGRLGEELVRVVGVIGKHEDLERTVAQVRKKFLAEEAEARARQAAAAEAERQRQERDAAYKGAVASDDPAALKAFLKDYPEATTGIKLAQADEVRRRLRRLEPRNVWRPSRPAVTVVATIALLIFGIAGWGIFARHPTPASVRITAKERRHELQTGNLLLVESKLTAITDINAVDQLIATRLGFYRLPAQEADIVESEESWWWEPTKTDPNEFRMYIRNPSNAAIVGVLLKIHEGDCRSLKANPETSWDYFFLQFSSSLEAAHASVIRADMPFATRFQGCAVVTAVYAASQNTPQTQQSSTPFEDAAAAYGGSSHASLRLAADQGNRQAQFNLGLMYQKGHGVPQNYAEAMKWFSKAADQGHIDAQYSLGVMYANGQGVPQNDTEAVKWYRLAADQGLGTAQNNLGVMYASGRWRNGPGVSLDYGEAVKWYRLAADQGNADAEYNLGFMYANGQGVQLDYFRALTLFNLSAAHGNQNAVKGRDIAAQHMNPAQIAEAQKLAREWKPQSTPR